MFINDWIHNDIIYIKDICTNRGFITPERLSLLIDMKRILTAIPRSWKDIIKSADTQTEWNRPQLNLYIENTDGEQIDILQPTLTTKMIYKTVKNKLFIRPYVEASWQQRFGIDIDWNIAWKRKVKLFFFFY